MSDANRRLLILVRQLDRHRVTGASHLVAACVAILLGIVTSAAPVSANDLDNILASAADGSRIPAIGALLILNGKVAELAVHGLRRNDQPDPVQVNDVWLIGSDAKPMTAALIARMVDRGLLSWDAPLSKMLPMLASTLRPEYRSMTLRQLLSHRSGLPHDVADMSFFNGFYADPRPLPEQRLAYISQALKDAPVAPPGTKFSYSNTGFIVASVVAERAAGVAYEDLMHQEIFDPLQMSSVGYGPTHNGQPMGHHNGKPATPADGNPLMVAPAGNIYMSLPDWGKFCLDQLAGAKGHGKLLSASSYHLMQTALPGMPTGLGWGVQKSKTGRDGTILTHAGSDGNWYALVILFPDSGNGALIATNAGADAGGDKADELVLDALRPTLRPPSP